MLIIPELQIILIFPPRTASGSLYRAVRQRYPRSMFLYRHMEMSGLPLGYDQWPSIGVIREPTARLWSLFKFIHTQKAVANRVNVEDMRASIAGKSFNEWLVTNQWVFASGEGGPHWSVRHPLPENFKSQRFYVTLPERDVFLYNFDSLLLLAGDLDIDLGRHNTTDRRLWPELSTEAVEIINTYHDWDIWACRNITKQSGWKKRVLGPGA